MKLQITINKTKKGFTLIELLVVIAIIALIAAILFPVFARARENARRASCLSNLKQIGLAMMMYTQDYDERYPQAVFSKGSLWSGGGISGAACAGLPCSHFNMTPGGVFAQGDWYSWMDTLYPYTRSIQVYECPSITPTTITASPPLTPADSDLPHYGYNGYVSNWEYPPYIPLSMAAISNPSQMVLIMDFHSIYAIYVNPGTYGGWDPNNSTRISSEAPHFDGTNVTYADGHAKWEKLSSPVLKAGSNNPYWCPTEPGAACPN